MCHSITRLLRPALVLLSLLVVAPVKADESPTPSTGCLSYAREQARIVAAKPYQTPITLDESRLQALNYDGYRLLRFRPEKTLWRAEDLPFQLELLPPGLAYKKPVRLYTWEHNQATEIRFTSDYFETPELLAPLPQAQAGFTGFRVLYPIKPETFHNEFFVFQGSTYFRGRSAGQGYGISARGLAINTEVDRKQEEFPDYTAFWIEKPSKNATFLRVCALLESPSVTGVSQFEIHPDKETYANIETTFYWRTTQVKQGIAPLTSMFFHGENTINATGDYRPEVHDSDGLLIQTQQGFEWHPLYVPEVFTAHAIAQTELKAFGLLQRDRVFDHYQDLEAHYQDRPSVWITPLEAWGKGQIRLMHFPTESDVLDNVVAFWEPEVLTPEQTWKYRLTWLKDEPYGHQLGKAVSTRLANKNVDSLPNQDGLLRFFIDFAQVPNSTEAIQAQVSVVGDAAVQASYVQANPHIPQGWRLVLTLKPELQQCEKPLVLLAHLIAGGKPVTETWVYPVSAELCRHD